MKKISSILTAFILTALLLTGCQCKHEWVDATCETPKTCTKCSETEGEALGHKWVAATCEEARHCSICGTTDGEPLGHDWAEATCYLRRFCPKCGRTEGEPLGHTPSDWIEEPDYVTATVALHKRCLTCGLVMEEKTEAIEKLYQNGVFLFSPKEFVSRFDEMTQTLEQEYAITPYKLEEGYIFCEITHGQDAVGDVMFSTPEGFVMQNKWETDNLIYHIMLTAYDSDHLVDLAACVVRTCDPTVETHTDALNLVANIVINSNGSKNLNGIQYFTSYENQLKMYAFDVFAGNS